MSITEINQEVQKESLFLQDLKHEIAKIIVGQDDLIKKILVALIADGHILIEGVPGLAKTLTVKTLAEILNGSFQRIQFTPDLLPADVTGTLILILRRVPFQLGKGLFLPIWFWQMKLTDPRRKSKAPCLKQCRKDK